MANKFYKFESEFERKLECKSQSQRRESDSDWEYNESDNDNSKENYFKIISQCRKSESDWGSGSDNDCALLLPKIQGTTDFRRCRESGDRYYWPHHVVYLTENERF